MCRNLGKTEKSIRFLVGGASLLAVGFLGLPAWGTLTLVVVGIVAIVTGALEYCPAWALLGINTCRTASHMSLQKDG